MSSMESCSSSCVGEPVRCKSALGGQNSKKSLSGISGHGAPQLCTPSLDRKRRRLLKTKDSGLCGWTIPACGTIFGEGGALFSSCDASLDVVILISRLPGLSVLADEEDDGAAGAGSVTGADVGGGGGGGPAGAGADDTGAGTDGDDSSSFAVLFFFFFLSIRLEAALLVALTSSPSRSACEVFASALASPTS